MDRFIVYIKRICLFILACIILFGLLKMGIPLLFGIVKMGIKVIGLLLFFAPLIVPLLVFYHAVHKTKGHVKDNTPKPKTPDFHLEQLTQNLKSVQCEKGIKQLGMLHKKHQNFKEIVAAKLSTDELTCVRYTAMGDQVYLAILNALEQSFLTLKSITSIDKEYMSVRLEGLEHNESKSAEVEKETLKQRQGIWQQQINYAADILARNEQALTELDLVTSRVANVDMNEGRVNMDLDLATKELSRLSQMVGQ
ncbi:MAG: hypothetical protein V3U75_09475 [Methylococcaceae bacterium]